VILAYDFGQGFGAQAVGQWPWSGSFVQSGG
jgi:hypothetical protein